MNLLQEAPKGKQGQCFPLRISEKSGENSQVGKANKKSRKARAHGNPQVLKGESDKDSSAPVPVAPPYIDLDDGQLFPFDGKALAQLARGTSVVIATCMALPDAVALIPITASPVSWALRLIGNWTIALVLWFVGFLALTNAFRLISRGIVLTNKGLRISRLDRLIPYSNIHAVALEPNHFFTRIFSLPDTARRTTILFDLGFGGKLVKGFLFPNYVPSFFFSRPTYDAFVLRLLQNSKLQEPTHDALNRALEPDLAFCSLKADKQKKVATTFRFLNKQAIFLPIIIAISLTIFLGKKAVVNFLFNSGSKAVTEAHYEKARDYYDLAVKLDPTFAVAWNSLGELEFVLADRKLASYKKAVNCWNAAVMCKLDYVEPRLHLARLDLMQRNFAGAEEKISHALKLAPAYPLSQVEAAELDFRLGRFAKAIEHARLALTNDSNTSANTHLAKCLIARSLLALNDESGAMREIQDLRLDPSDYAYGENVSFLLMTRAKIESYIKHHDMAIKLANQAMQRQPRNYDFMVDAARIYIDSGEVKWRALVPALLAKAEVSGWKSPWIFIERARLALADDTLSPEKRQEAVRGYVQQALAMPDSLQDAQALGTCAEFLEEIGSTDKNADKSLAIAARSRAAVILGK